MAPCLLCREETEHRLTGEASVGNRHASYDMHICPGCWYLFEKLGTGAQDVRAEIARQVQGAAWPTA